MARARIVILCLLVSLSWASAAQEAQKKDSTTSNGRS